MTKMLGALCLALPMLTNAQVDSPATAKVKAWDRNNAEFAC